MTEDVNWPRGFGGRQGSGKRRDPRLLDSAMGRVRWPCRTAGNSIACDGVQCSRAAGICLSPESRAAVLADAPAAEVADGTGIFVDPESLCLSIPKGDRLFQCSSSRGLGWIIRAREEQGFLFAYSANELADARFPCESGGSGSSTNATLLVPCSACFRGPALGTCIASRSHSISVG
jgi:hypothetical protein